MYQSSEETTPSAESVADDAAEYGILPPELRELLREDLDFIPDDPAELRRAVRDMAAHIDHADWRFIKLIAAMERTRGWTEAGYASLGNWLDHRCGLGPCAARERIRIGRALARLPHIDAAFRDGVLSYSPEAPGPQPLPLPRLRAPALCRGAPSTPLDRRRGDVLGQPGAAL